MASPFGSAVHDVESRYQEARIKDARKIFSQYAAAEILNCMVSHLRFYNWAAACCLSVIEKVSPFCHDGSVISVERNVPLDCRYTFLIFYLCDGTTDKSQNGEWI